MDFLSSLSETLAELSILSKTALALGIFFVTTNLKGLPFVWHIRCFNGLIKHLYRAPVKWRGNPQGPAAIFQPIITASHAPLLECDFNGHKSSSTYLTDLDVSRLHLIPCLFGQGIKSLGSRPITGPNGDKVNGKISFNLGAIECNYRREIKPYGKYEMWTRVIAWDRKWLYIVSHFVKPGTVLPQGYTLAKGNHAGGDIPSSKKSFDESETRANGHGAAANGKTASPASQVVYASAISKYVFKKGRLTLHPEIVLEASGLLPVRPGGWATTAGPAPMVEDSTQDEEDGWTWQKVEAENAAGLKLANNFAALDGLFDVFTGSDRSALGRYSDLGI